MLALMGEMLGGTLAPEDAVRLEAHLAACPDCRARGESYCALDRALWEMAAQARVSELLPAAVRRAPGAANPLVRYAGRGSGVGLGGGAMAV